MDFSTPPLEPDVGTTTPQRAAWHRARAAALRRGLCGADEGTRALTEAAAAFHERRAEAMDRMVSGDWRRWP